MANYEAAAYYFPNYHRDKRNDAWHGEGWTEWELVKRAEPKFPGHQQPKVPLWGYEDEADPAVMARKIAAAADYGLTAFIFDWYWYEDGPFLQRALDEGFLQAPNNDRLKFAIMWANHDWIDIHPAQRSRPYNVQAEGQISEKGFIEATDHMIQNYFSHPSYWRVNEGLYVSFYEIHSLIRGLGGMEETARILLEFRERVRAAGLGELHLNVVVWGLQILPTEQKIANIHEVLEQLGLDSISSYVWIHHQPLDLFPETDYAAIVEKSQLDYETFTADYKLPYYPNVTMGWDSSPRTVQSETFEDLGYPYMATLAGNTPQAFKLALEGVKAFLDRGVTQPSIFTINAWNEWTEGSYLEPDTINGMAYLEAIRDVFGGRPQEGEGASTKKTLER
ncbi:glycosyltransferase WbsX family protein [Paenibacillus sp. MAH-36]|uniref:Glycoside hydrolase family 99-like domain-containing protein n=1 Tax=Paenibacillus violae TaxID=3077234 RepID=A0ABU3R6A7_9BACL|nr:glycoside hydrolase family 99-like domain-containing protein [Paenibacillus sp. PFR10]MDU0199614.1 glycoside hydrolase family 99-like domain-containing protein [Paenibacillus sp. PFR10]